MVSPPDATDWVRPYRLLLVTIAAGNAAFAAAHRLDGMALHDPLWLRAAVSGLALAVAAGIRPGGLSQRVARTLVYGVAYVLVGVSVVLCVWNRFDPSVAVGYLALVAALGLGGAVTSTRPGALVGVMAAAVVLPLAGLAATDVAGVGRAAFGLSLLTTVSIAVILSYERTRARARFVAEQALYRSVFEQASDGMLVADAATRRVLDANPAFLRLSGYPLADVCDFDLDALLDVRPDEALPRVRTRTGRTVEVDVSTAQIERADGTAALSVVVRDATARLAAERALRDAADEATAARARAEELLRLKTSFLSNMSHEIRTPLTAILGYADLLADEVSGETAEMVAVIARGATRLHRTLNSVLDIARLEADDSPVATAPVDLAAEAAAAVDALRPLACAQNLTIAWESAAPCVWAAAEPGAVARILDNLVGNAIKFTEAGGVTVRVGLSGDRATIAVADTGPGIPEAFRPTLFAEFEQASTGYARTHEGSGLGLAITRRLVGRLGGTIAVESTLGCGTTFTVALPACPTPLGVPVG